MYFPKIDNNPHLAKITEHFGVVDSREMTIPETTRFIFICFTNRCGSNYLADLISSSGEYNFAGEDMNWDTVINHSTANKLDNLESYFEFLMKRVKKSERVFLKVAISHLELLCSSGILQQIFKRSTFIQIERSDKLGQAISHSLAFATGRYTSYMPGQKPPEKVAFSRNQIDNIINSIADSYRYFDLFFSKNGVIPVNVIYEQLADAPAMHMSFIAQSIGLMDFQISLDKLRLEKQSGAVNAKWRELYLSDQNR